MGSFYVLVAVLTLSTVGSRMTSLAIGIRVFDDTGTTAPLLLVMFFNELPSTLLSSLTGVWVDRWDRRWVVALADAGQAVGSALLILSFLSGHFALWHLYAVSLLQGLCIMFQEPARVAIVATLVPDRQLDRANALQGMTHSLAGVVAAPLTGLIYVSIGVVGIVLIDLVSFVVAIGALLAIPLQRQAHRTTPGEGPLQFWRELRDGFEFLRRSPALRALILYAACANFLLNGSLGLSVPYLLSILGSERAAGGVMAFESLGALVGGMALAAAGPHIHSRVRVIRSAMLVVGGMFVFYGAARSATGLAIAIFGLLAALQVWSIFTTLLQVHTPPGLHGRVLSIIHQLGCLGATASFLCVGPFVDRVLEPAVGGPGWAPFALLVGAAPGAGIGLFLVLTGVALVALTALAFALPALRRLDPALGGIPLNVS